MTRKCSIKNRRNTVRDVQDSFEIGYGLPQEILTQDLEMQQACAKWVLQPEQKMVRVRTQRSLGKIFDESSSVFQKSDPL